MARILTITLNPALDLTVRVPHLEPVEVNRSQALLSHAAGKGLNVAQVLADLGHSLTVSGFLGEDNQQAFNALFARRGFADAFIRVPGETRSNIKLAEDDGRVTDINGPGPHVNDLAQHALLDKLDHIAASHDAVVVAGSLPRGVSAQWLRELVLRQRFRYSLSTPSGKWVIEETELVLERNITYSESDALSKAGEEQLMFNDMQSDAAQQVLRRLSALKSL